MRAMRKSLTADITTALPGIERHGITSFARNIDTELSGVGKPIVESNEIVRDTIHKLPQLQILEPNAVPIVDS